MALTGLEFTSLAALKAHHSFSSINNSSTELEYYTVQYCLRPRHLPSSDQLLPVFILYVLFETTGLHFILEQDAAAAAQPSKQWIPSPRLRRDEALFL